MDHFYQAADCLGRTVFRCKTINRFDIMADSPMMQMLCVFRSTGDEYCSLDWAFDDMYTVRQASAILTALWRQGLLERRGPEVEPTTGQKYYFYKATYTPEPQEPPRSGT